MRITFLPRNIGVDAIEVESILSVARKAGIPLPSLCGGYGICGKCKVKVISGIFSSMSKKEEDILSKEQQKKNIRLACFLYAKSDCTIEIQELGFSQDPKEKLEYEMDSDFLCDKWEVLDEYGIAFDIGTTSIVGILWNLYRGSFIYTKAKLNPQCNYGADVISRISYCMAETDEEQQKRTEHLQYILIDCINEIIQQLCESTDFTIKKEKIKKMVVVGNTTISHLFLGIVPKGLSKFPFQSSFQGAILKQAKELGLDLLDTASVYLLPNLGGYVGSDITADILAQGLLSKKGLFLIADIGTNGEIILSRNGEIYVCSTAAGPAFEGSCIYQGMRAEEGAIEKFLIKGDKIELSIIGSIEPKGICGSGLLDIVAELLNIEIIDKTGRLLDREKAKEKGISELLSNRLRKGKKGNEFVLFEGEQTDIVITQTDIREVQLAKAAIYAGIFVLLKEVEEEIENINCFMIAGAFGNYISKYSAVKIGLFPALDIKKFKFIGNAAGKGASMALLSQKACKDAENIAKKVNYVSLSNDMYFQEKYILAMNFPE